MRYDAGPDLTSPGGADQVAQIVWPNEFSTFDLLVIESRGTTVGFAYPDLVQRFGPQPNTTVVSVAEFCGVQFGPIDVDKGLGGGASFVMMFVVLMAGAPALALFLFLITAIPVFLVERRHRRDARNKRK